MIGDKYTLNNKQVQVIEEDSNERGFMLVVNDNNGTETTLFNEETRQLTPVYPFTHNEP